MSIHKSAIIAENAKIGQNVKIGPNAVIGENVILEDNVEIGASAFVEYSHIKQGTRIFPMASIGAEPQDLGYKGELTGVVIGENCIIREFVTINRASGEGNMTTVGNKCLLMAYSHIAHNCTVEDEVIFANAATIGGHCKVGRGAFLGGQSVYHQNLNIGEMSIVSGASAARKDLLPYCKFEGIPAAPCGINSIGLRRKGVDKASQAALHVALRTLKSGKYNTTQALEVIEKEIEKNEYVDKLVDFIRSSKRGVSLKNKAAYDGTQGEANE